MYIYVCICIYMWLRVEGLGLRRSCDTDADRFLPPLGLHPGMEAGSGYRVQGRGFRVQS